MSTVIKQTAAARLPTAFGNFRIFIYEGADGLEHAVLATEIVPPCPLVRIHSQCLTGDTLLSLKCDCRQQLHKSLELIAARGGYLLYLNQEGRGIGLANKIRAYALQDSGLDTVAANEALGFRPDEREYQVAADILKDLGASEIELITNNPSKVAALTAAGIKVVAERRLAIEPTDFNAAYLATKVHKLGHYIV